jgi:hypothetical protein
MALFRCNKCAHLQEQPDEQIGATIACPRCAHPTQVYPTLFFVGRLLDKYFDAQREIIRLKAPPGANPTLPSVAAAPSAPPTAIDLSNTAHLTSEQQHEPIAEWFRRKHIVIQIDSQAVDTTGFFDEVAMSIGGNLPVLKDVLNRIRGAQQRAYSSTVIGFDGKSPEDVRAITSFCQQLYDFSFVAKAIPNRQKNNLLLALQPAAAIRHFFNGEWLEWFALMTCLEYSRERKKRFSCARKLGLTLSNEERHELDVFMLIDGQLPIVIECKSGEFRQDIDKYLTVRKRLGLNGKNIVLCIADLPDEHAKGLTAMYDLTFVSERGLLSHLSSLF